MESLVRTRAQLHALGFSDAQVDNKLRRRVWTSQHRGVVVPSWVSLTFADRITAGLRAVGPEAVVGRRTAADYWKLDGLPFVAEPELQPIELWVPPEVN